MGDKPSDEEAHGGPPGPKWDRNNDNVPDVLNDPEERARLLKKYGYTEDDLKFGAKKRLFYQAVRKEYSKKEAKEAYKGVYKNDDVDFDKLLAEWHFSLGIIKQNPELQRMFERISDRIARGVWPEDAKAAQAEFDRLLDETKFGQRPDREIFADLQRYGAGAETFADNVKKLMDEIGRVADGLAGGSFNLSREDRRKVALDLVYHEDGFRQGSGFDPEVVKRYLKPYVRKYLKESDNGTTDVTDPSQDGVTSGIGGDLGDTRNTLMRWFSNNGITVTKPMLDQYLLDIDAGKVTVDQVKQTWRDGYMTRNYGQYADLFKGGVDIADVAADYRSRAAALLEKNDVSFDDPLVQRALQTRGPDGKPVQMTLYDFERMVRTSPEWDLTTNARSAYTDIGESILRSFGFRG